MRFVPTQRQEDGAGALDAVICVDGESVARLTPILRHLCVGLVDQAVRLRILSSDPAVTALSLGPVQAIVHPRIGCFLTRRRIDRIVDALAPRLPVVVHAASGESYELARAVAEALDVEAVLNVSSVEDCERIATLSAARPPHLIAAAEPIQRLLRDQVRVSDESVSLVRPGVLARKTRACFSHDDYTATLLCASALERDRRIDVFIETVAELRDRRADVLGFLVGVGRREADLRRRVRRRNLSPIVTFASGPRRASVVMDSSDIFVVPAPSESVAFNVLQAMGSGMACVVAPNAVSDFIQDGRTALVCAELTAAAFAERIEQLLIDRDAARTLADAGMHLIREFHTVSAMARGTAAVYRRVSRSHATYTVNP